MPFVCPTQAQAVCALPVWFTVAHSPLGDTLKLYMKMLTSLSPDASNIPDSLQRPMEWSTGNVLSYVKTADQMTTFVDCGGLKFLLRLLKHHACQGLVLRFESKNTLRFAVTTLANLSMEPMLKSCFHQELAADVLACYLDVPDAPCKLSALETLARIATEQDLDIICNAQGAISLLTDMVNRPSYKDYTLLENIGYPATGLVQTLTLVSITAGIRKKTLQPGAELDEEALQEILPELREKLKVETERRDYTLEWGDIAVHPTRRSVQKWPKAGDGRIYVPYKVSVAFYDGDVKKIEEAALEFEKKTCVRFIPRSEEADYISIHAWEGNWSFLGRQGGDQAMSLEPGKVTKGVVLHEFMHALGFHHEHCRSDRDDHVWVLSANIDPEWKDAIEKKTSQVHMTPYDYSSITHYSTTAGSRDGKSATMLPKHKSSTLRFGGGHSLSDGDVEKIKEMFEREPAIATPSTATSQPGSSTDCFAQLPRGHYHLTSCQKSAALLPFPRAQRALSPCGVKDGVSAGRVGRWPQSPGGQVCIPYKLSAAFYDYDVEAIMRAIQEFEKKTCVRFKPHAGETDFIHIQDLGGKSWSLLGNQGGEQPLSLEPGKVTKGMVLHELMHALGFQHEHCRSDRDKHVWVVPENIKEEWRDQIVDIKSNEQDLAAPYDCSSIMHYSMLAGSVDERNPTIIPRDVLSMLHMGQSNSLSPCDVVKVQKLYGYKAEVHATPAGWAAGPARSLAMSHLRLANLGEAAGSARDEASPRQWREWKEKTDPLRNLIKELMEIRWYDASSVPRLQSLLDVLSQDRPENEKEMLWKVFKEEGGSVLLMKILESCKFDDSRVQVRRLVKNIALLLSQHESTSGENEFEKTGDIMGDLAEEIKLWPEQSGKVYIPYNVSIAFNTNDKENIQQAVNEFADETCVRLIRKDNQEDYINFQALDGSWSFLGKKGGAQSVSLEPGKVDRGTVLHTLMHALGFHHEHCRSDRDQHIKVHEDNIEEDELGQFKRLECSGCGEDLPYDYLSIMHYGRYASSSDHMSETITPTTAAKAPIGQRSGLSPLDVLRVQRKYQPVRHRHLGPDSAFEIFLHSF
ncbi:unnamed protein product [Lampetra fluviatilis]